MTTSQLSPGLLAFALAGACATAPAPRQRPAGPRGLRASEHLDVARDYEERARERAHAPEEQAGPNGVGSPWMRRWDTSNDDEQIAAIHRSKAAELQASFEEACGSRPLADITISPLQRYSIGVTNTANGASFLLAPSAGPPDRLMADIRCHRAWMMLSPSNMEDCPLDLPGLEITAQGEADSITVSIVVRDPRYVEELHRRAAHDVEASLQLHQPSTR